MYTIEFTHVWIIGSVCLSVCFCVFTITTLIFQMLRASLSGKSGFEERCLVCNFKSHTEQYRGYVVSDLMIHE